MADKQLLAGAATTVLTPSLGVSLCGSTVPRAADHVHDELHARCLVLDNGDTRVALVVLDLIAATKEWLGAIKHQVHGFTGIPLTNILISCTHTHSAPTPVHVFQSNAEKAYLAWAGPRVADCVRLAVHRLQPARVGWGVGREDRVVFNRRYFMKAGTKLPSPFPGGQDKVKMNPGELNPAIDRPAGPIDPEVSVLAVQKAANPSGQPLAVYASYALHYVGRNPPADVSADYFGVVADRLTELTGGPRRDPKQPFVAMLANGCFGDINNIDVSRRQRFPSAYHQIHAVADTVASGIHEAWRTIKYHDWIPLAAQERTLELAVRKPSADDVKQAKELLARAPQGHLTALPEIYARETVQLADWPERFKTPVQALQIGDLGVCALPGEPFCQTGLDIKARSPFKPTLLVGMANDYAGYLPTEEQHALGGYETWRAKSSFLEVAAAKRESRTMMDATLFDNLQHTLATAGPDTAVERLCAHLREQKDYGNLFYALLMKRRHELGVSPIPTGSAQALPAEMHERYEDAIRDAGQTVGRLYLDAGDIPRAWFYYRLLNDAGPIRAALEQYQPGDDEESGQVIEIAFHHGVHPQKGFDWIIQRYGICNAITTVTGQDFANNGDLREYCVRQLTHALYEELRERLKADVENREGPVAGNPTVRALLQGRNWLTAEDCYHVDVSHLTAVVQMAIHLRPGEELELARELCEYGRRLSPQFQYPGDPPFNDHYRDYGTYLSVLAGDDVEEGIAHFRKKAEEADPYEVGTYPAQVLVNLLLRLDRPKEALTVARRFLASADPQQISCPSIPELCQKAGDFQALAEVAREQGDAVHFLAGLLASARK